MENFNKENAEILKNIFIAGLIGYTILFCYVGYLIIKFFKKNKFFK